MRFIRKDGNLTWVKIKLSMLRNRDGRALYCIALAEDINIGV